MAQSMIKAAELEQQGLNDLVYLSAVVSEPCTYIAQMLPTGLQVLPNHVHVCKSHCDVLDRLSIDEAATRLPGRR